MLPKAFFALLGATALAVPAPLTRRDDLSSQIENEWKIAFQGVLNNIGPTGSQAPGASAGAIVASPSTENPNYFYTWTRDSALTMKMMIDQFIGGDLRGDTELRTYIENYIKAQAILQTVSNPSGALASGRGLGEPKFYLNLTRFNGDWGRPQRDGPALRATALITYSRWLLSTGNDDDAGEAKDKIWPVIQNDLNYVAQYWNTTGFDLWEEVKGSSVFATAVQHRALVEGTALGQQLGQSTDAYESQAPNILCFLQSYWNGQYDVANTNVEQEGFSRKGIDANTVLTSLATFDPAAKCDDALFQPCSPRALANLKVYVDSFRSIYAINANTPNNSAVATGRYAEDIYFDGNPWYLTTLAVAEQLYDAVQQWDSAGSIGVTATDLAFWQTIYPGSEASVYEKSDDNFGKMIDAVLNYADGFVEIALKYTPSSGALAEQFSRENGTALSARDLTWSYASFVTMRGARLAATGDYAQVPSWGASNNASVPATCQAGGVPGVYRAAVAAGAPNDTASCTVIVDFDVNATTFYGENIYLYGNTSDLGNWDVNDALAGSASNYTSERPLWTFSVELPAAERIEYSYLRKEPNGTVIGEAQNRTLMVAPCADKTEGDGEGTGADTVEDSWVGPTGSPSKRAVKAFW